MNCPSCGKPVDDNAAFCTECGAALQAAAVAEEPVQEVVPEVPQEPVQEVAQEIPQEPVQNIVQEPAQEAGYPSGKGILTMGILALVFCEIGIGVIFGAIGLSRAKAYVKNYGKLVGSAKPGKVLSLIGLIVSIIMIVFWILYFLFLGVLIANY